MDRTSETVSADTDSLPTPPNGLTGDDGVPHKARNGAASPAQQQALKPDGPPAARPPAAGPEDGAAASGTPPPASLRRAGRKRFVLLAIALLALAGGGYEGYHWWTVGRFEVSTDDAYVGADVTVVASKVSGYVAEVDVDENQPVSKGDVIARVDDGDYRLAVQQAKDRIAAQQATVSRIAVQIGAAGAAVDQAQAEIAGAKADVQQTSLELDRQTKLVKSAFASRQKLDNARAGHDKAVAALKAAQAQLASAKAEIAVLKAQKVEAEQSLQGLKTALAQAERDLSFTVVRAPVDGVIGNKSVEVGRLVQPGDRLVAVVPLDDVYIDANFKETQLESMHAGQIAEISVDAYPDRTFAGEVKSISPASGALFSLLPPENATGNFTKIVQRLPVRIRLDGTVLRDHVLRPGMSVVVTVDTRTGAGTATASGEDRTRLAGSH